MKRLFIAVIMSVLVVACQDEQLTTEVLSSDVIIKTGTICGWCSRNDTLSIVGNATRYVNYTQCDNSKPAVENKGTISAGELDTLIALLDFDAFKKIDLNTCNICFDGCDTWLFVKKGTATHQIRFTGNEDQLQPIKDFIDLLNTIKLNYQ